MASLTHILVIAITILCVSACLPVDPGNAILRKYDTVVCGKTTELIWTFSLDYFKDKWGLDMITDTSDSLDYFIADILKCIPTRDDNILPVMHHRGKWNHTETNGQRSEATQIFKSSIVNGIILISYNPDSAMDRLKLIAKFDSSTKVVIILFNWTSDGIKSTLESSWRDYQILNVVILHITKPVDSKLVISAYDPFKNSKNANRGSLATFVINDKSYIVGRILTFLQNRLRNVQGYPLRICIFDYPGFAAPQRYVNGTVTKFSLIDGEIMHALASTINFRPLYTYPRDNLFFGYKTSNGTMVGSLREIEEGNADILGNIRIVKDYGQKKSVYIFPIMQMEFAFLAPKMNSTSEIAFLTVFTTEVLLAISAAYLLVVMIWWYMQNVYLRWSLNNDNTVGLAEIFLITFGDSLMYSQNERKYRFERCLFIMWSFVSIVNCSLYQGKMIEHLIGSKVSLDIDTLQQLAESDLKVVTFDALKEIVEKIAQADGTPDLYKRLYEKQMIISDKFDALHRVSLIRDAALLSPRSLCKAYQSLVHQNETRKNWVHISKEGPPARYSSHMVPWNSPYKDRFNQVLMRITEGGFITKWEKDSYYGQDLKWMSTSKNTKELLVIYTMQELSFVFVSWFVCCMSCIVVFLLELLYAKKSTDNIIMPHY